MNGCAGIRSSTRFRVYPAESRQAVVDRMRECMERSPGAIAEWEIHLRAGDSIVLEMIVATDDAAVAEALTDATVDSLRADFEDSRSAPGSDIVTRGSSTLAPA